MSDDLHRFAEDVREKSSFRTGVVDGPGDTARGLGRQTYPCVPTPWPNKNAVLPTGGVIFSGVTGLGIEVLKLDSSFGS
jgi:hypothetical protein